jgi:hypothetical protein
MLIVFPAKHPHCGLRSALSHPRRLWFYPGQRVPSKEADNYALGITVYQVLTGNQPVFPRREAEVIHAVVSDGRPLKPVNAEKIEMTEVAWGLLREC